MKDLHKILDEAVNTIELNIGSKFENFLTEELDFNDSIINEADDPFASDGGDAAGGDAGADPFASDGGDAPGGDAGADPFASNGGGDAGTGTTNSSDASTENGNENKENQTDTNDDLDLDNHEDDPEYIQGTNDTSDITLTKSPAIKAQFDIEKLMQTFESVIQTIDVSKLAEIKLIKKDYELIWNGKILNEEDLEFKDIKTALYVLRQVGKKLATKEKNYLYRKFKEPLLKKRDQLKIDIATQQGELSNARDMITLIDTESE